jgi:hypothetical protein
MRWLALLFMVGSAMAQHSATVDNLSTNQQGNNITNNSNSNNTNSATTYNGNAPGSVPPSPPPSAIAPSYMGGGQDSCLIGVSGSVSSSVIGIGGGTYRRDQQCELLKLAKTLNEFGLKVAAVAILCQDARVFQGMAMAGTPCPYLGAIGKQATLLWQQNPEMRPDYETQPLKPISQGVAATGSDSGSLSDRFRASKRANADAQPASGGQ